MSRQVNPDRSERIFNHILLALPVTMQGQPEEKYEIIHIILTQKELVQQKETADRVHFQITYTVYRIFRFPQLISLYKTYGTI